MAASLSRGSGCQPSSSGVRRTRRTYALLNNEKHMFCQGHKTSYFACKILGVEFRFNFRLGSAGDKTVQSSTVDVHRWAILKIKNEKLARSKWAIAQEPMFVKIDD